MPLPPARVAKAVEIDSEDEAWDGKIEETVFQQVAEKEERARIVARLEAHKNVNLWEPLPAQNRDPKASGRRPSGRGPGTGADDSVVTAGAAAVAAASKEASLFSSAVATQPTKNQQLGLQGSAAAVKIFDSLPDSD
mmetsp:Transcript_33544/g.89203  ORF Transcript_33544/g.89203 Transcript_33544/m.89203 type:complete len:137 (-) Transcript_33544:272-682(-)